MTLRPGSTGVEMKHHFIRRFLTICSLSVPLFLLPACTRSSVPLAEVTKSAATESSPTDEAPQPTFIPFKVTDTFGVVWVARDDQLAVHNPAGVAGGIVQRLEYDARGIHLTGNSTSLGSSLWVEISTIVDQTGWVNFWNLTEDVTTEAFCADERAYDLAYRAVEALVNQDGLTLASMANSQRGLTVRQEWWNPGVSFSSEQIEKIFEERASFDWGEQSGGEFHVTGSFQDVIYPLLQDVLDTASTPICNEIPAGVSSTPAEWPSEYQNLHYYVFLRPAPEKGNRYDWRAWGFGFEYIKGVPHLTVLVHFHGDV
jgi:hypothetical protein